jgi:hypothetical protein
MYVCMYVCTHLQVGAHVADAPRAQGEQGLSDLGQQTHLSVGCCAFFIVEEPPTTMAVRVCVCVCVCVFWGLVERGIEIGVRL